ncbi:exopolysaccharide biosynthesis polyprenyl glycosylphosphotransferase [Amycolatopsis marina]|uniref:Exopolysaccharide biosynthesis polyprenyl glycosylphosphotransferase n=1 Tax=Amycolatopsis marina TaxID=490629 RepID=A0A1I0ZD42_9PSEU|nr:sugar transferase [Amycolatopsis marina]SFB23046.1 exopolysaccharide biosynthesis polyprenyl glycosylphosphotransferase [Amycolatopsis marina]
MDESARSLFAADGEAPGSGPRPSSRAGRWDESSSRVRLRSVPEPVEDIAPALAWERRYLASVITADVLVTLLVVALAVVFIEGLGGPVGVHQLIAFGTVLAVLAALPATRAWSLRVLGAGSEEFSRLGRGLFIAAVLIALAGLISGSLAVQAWVFVVVPVIALVAFPLRYLLRRLLHGARRRGECLLPVMAAGAPGTVRELIERTRTESHVGWRVEAVCTTEVVPQSDSVGETGGTGAIAGVPVVGGLGDLSAHVRRGGYRVVAVTADPYWTPRRLQQLAWDLEGTSAEMVVAPVLMEVAGPRLNVSGVLGMPLLRVSAPQFTGGKRLIKDVVDRVGALTLLTLCAPLLLLIAAWITVSDRGPVIYRQRRVGRGGREFTMYKFRTMIVDADRVRHSLMENNEAAGPLFKLRKDPRVTRVGVFLRRYSLDELPQLFNVLSGRMSLVGPRPPLPEETAEYAPDARRRLLVKPGLTGLWQVSGRSDLTWAESVRLDLRYVEDWSLALDMVILWKTLRAVVGGYGAY